MYKTSLFLNGDDYDVIIYDAEPAGLLCSMTHKAKQLVFTRAFSKVELEQAGLVKSQTDCVRLVESLCFVVSLTQEVQIHSRLPGISPPEPIATSTAAEVYLSTTTVGREKLMEVLGRGLIVLCKEKPMGLNAVLELGKWLLENNPNQPMVDK
ncbi:hypothetical protein THRCLA_22440 [Thraustotheca clavata]|uniref:Uncharacterized protein n=1 Tax=Thraustotheca clavata TaxID=74557 RepID=A0A1V9Z193_9STRA|nr:hypothetical protein THRCLA_22440 [Thraustotheca clavata]